MLDPLLARRKEAEKLLWSIGLFEFCRNWLEYWAEGDAETGFRECNKPGRSWKLPVPLVLLPLLPGMLTGALPPIKLEVPIVEFREGIGLKSLSIESSPIFNSSNALPTTDSTVLLV